MAVYGALTLQLKALSNLADIGSPITEGLTDARGKRVVNGVGDGSFRISIRNATATAAIISGRVAYCFVNDEVAAGAAMDICAFIIEKIAVDVTDSGTFLVVSGPDIIDELTDLSPGNEIAIDDGAGGPVTTDVTDIMASAPAGWSTVFQAGSGTEDGTYHVVMGESVLEMLVKTAAQSGEFFRLGFISPPTKVVEWLRTPSASGVTLRMTDPVGAEGSTTIGIILNLSEEKEQAEIVTRIYPYGAGLAEGRLNLTNITATETGGDPTGYTTDFAGNSITNDTLETAMSGRRIERHVDFSHIEPEDAEDATALESAAVALWKTAIDFLEERDTATKIFYRVTCIVHADVKPGNTVALVYAEFEGGISGGTQVVDTDGTFVVHEVENSVGSDGLRYTTFLLGEGLRKQPTAARAQAGSLISHRDTIRHAPVALVPGFVLESRSINTLLPILIDGLQTADLSADRTISLNGLTTYGTANYLVGVQNPAGGWEYKQAIAGDGIDITHAAGSITFDANFIDASFVVIGATADLANERVLTAGTGITITDNGAGGTVVIDSTAGGAASDEAYVTIGNTAGLSAERALTAGDGLDLADGGANSTATLSVDVTDIIGNGLTETTNNIVLGTPGTITSTSTNAVTASSHTHAINSTIALSDAAYVTIGNPAGLTAERALTAGDGIDLADAGANNTVTLSVDVTDILGNGLTETTNNIVLGTPGTLTVSSTNAVTASSHTHAITSSSNPGAAAAILASNASGYLQLVRLGLGIAPTAPLHVSHGTDATNVIVAASGASAFPAVSFQDLVSSSDVNTGKTFEIKVAGESFGRGMFYSDGGYGIGGGAATRDVFIDRVGVNTMRVSSNKSTGAGNLQFNSTGWVGLGSSSGRFIFNSTGPVIQIQGADLHLSDGSVDRLKIRRSGDVNSTEADIYANDRMGLAADSFVGVFIDANNDSTNAYFAIFKDAENFSAATELMRFDEAGALHIGDVINTNMTVGVNINQGANDDTALAIKSSDVAHGMTSIVETDTYYDVVKFSATAGGAVVRGFSEATVGLDLSGLGVTDDTTKSASSVGYVQVRAFKKSGTSVTTVGADGNLFVVSNNNAARFIVQDDGDLYIDGAGLFTYDEFDDAQLCRALDLTLAPDRVIRSEFDNYVAYNREHLAAAGIVTFNDDGHHFVNITQHQRLLNGAVWQSYTRQRQLETRIEQLERQLGDGI